MSEKPKPSKFDSWILAEWENGHIHSLTLTDLRKLHEAELAHARQDEAQKWAQIVEALKNSTCWCGVGLDNPNYKGRHTTSCDFAREAIDKVAK